MQKIIDAINKAEHIALTCHSDPDGDAIGALLAMGLSLEKAGKRVGMYCPSRVSKVYQFLNGHEKIKTFPDWHTGHSDLGIVLDCSSLGRLGGLRSFFEEMPRLANVDHHNTNEGFGDFTYIVPNACSTAEIVYGFIKKMGIEIDYDIAVALYVGIVADTGSFRFPNTNAQAFAISSELMDLGVKPFDVAEYLFGDYRIGRLRLLNYALDSLEVSPDGRVSIMVITKDMLRETGTMPEDAKGLISYALHIKDIQIAALITEDAPCLYHVSLRSHGDIDVGSTAQQYGGGGHKNAAGFQIQITLPKLKALLRDMSTALALDKVA